MFRICVRNVSNTGISLSQLRTYSYIRFLKSKTNQMKTKQLFIIASILFISAVKMSASDSQREKLLMDFNWKFAYGHPSDATKDFNHGSAYFSYFAKAGYGDGAAAANFDDRAWRVLNLPHDYAVEQAFDKAGSHSHGYKAIGRNFPEVSVGWYRKSFTVPNEDLGKRISITFDGIHRDSKIWINGHYLGNESSGYVPINYDITEYLNYGNENVIAVRTDVTYEEGWFYEGAGIYRHVWLTKTNPLHVAQYGTFIYSEVNEEMAILNIETEVQNDDYTGATFIIKQQLLNKEGEKLAEIISDKNEMNSFDKKTIKQQLKVNKPHLWSIDDPYLHKVLTTIISKNNIVDEYETTIGIRTIKFEPDKGFFLNGEHIKLKGTNNHQDHAGVGTAIPDELQNFRISKLKEMGSNAYRTSHNAPTPELLDACDRLGMVVIDEHRLMGTAPFIKSQMEKLIKRDRNHPCVVVWSLGNEEWAIEGNITGERIIQNMMIFANKLDSTRPKNAASSGGWGEGVSKHIEVMGFNYLNHGNTDNYHRDFPNTACIGTEEGSTNTTRGIYFDNEVKQHIAAYDRPTPNGWFYSIEHCWKYYDSRDYMAGMFIWTGFDYRGEPTPYAWPSIHSYFGMYDVCGFPKDNVWYLKSWWGNEPVLHLLPHWNWKDKEGDTIKVVAYSNCDEVELFVNKKSVGKKAMEKNSHLEWDIPYKAGSIKAIGFKNGKKQLTQLVETTSDAIALKMEAHKHALNADGEDIAIISVSAFDKKGRIVPTADNKVYFEIEGPGKIIGVGNGDNTSLEADKYIDQISILKIENIKAKIIDNIENCKEVALGYNDTSWPFSAEIQNLIQKGKAVVYRGELNLPEKINDAKISFFYNCIGNSQTLYLNGEAISEELKKEENERFTFQLDASKVKAGKNEIAIVATPFIVKNSWDTPNTDIGNIQLVIPAKQYNRSLFNGYAQVIVQTTKEPGVIKIKATSNEIESATIIINSNASEIRGCVK